MTPAIEVGAVDVDGRRVAFRQAGVGPPLVLLHGGVCDSRVFDDQLALLGPHFRVVAWDAPGCGGSSDPPDTWRLPDYTACLSGFLDAIGVGRPSLLGHSWGSAVALQLAARQPERTRRLVLVAAYAGWAGSLAPDEVARRLAFALETADRLPLELDPTTTPGLFSDRMPEAGVRLLTTSMRDIRPAATRAMAHGLAEADLRAELGRIAAPTLLLYGDADLRSSPAVGRALHEAIPGSELVVLSGLGHEMFLEAPREFAAAVTGFLRSPGHPGSS